MEIISPDFPDFPQIFQHVLEFSMFFQTNPNICPKHPLKIPKQLKKSNLFSKKSQTFPNKSKNFPNNFQFFSKNP